MYYKQLCEILGVQFNSEFKIKGFDDTFIFNKNGLFKKYRVLQDTGKYHLISEKVNDRILSDLISGSLKILPSVKDFQLYYHIVSDGNIHECIYTDTNFDRLNMRLKNVFLSRKDITQQDIDRIKNWHKGFITL